MHFIYSEDHFLLTKTINKLIKQINKEQNYEIEKFSLVHNSLSDIYNSLFTYSMFGENKIIIVEDAWCFTEEKVALNKTYDESTIYKIIDNTTDNVVIFSLNNEKISKRIKLAKYIEEKAKVLHIKKMSESQVVEYIETFLMKKEKNIDAAAAYYFYTKVSNSMQSLTNELEKISNLSENEITKVTIDENVSKYIENDVFDLSESFIKNESSKFLVLYKDYLLMNDDLIGLIALINTNITFFRDVQILKQERKTIDEITSILKAHPYRIRLALNNKLNITKLNSKIKLIYSIQKGLLDQTIDKENIAEYLFLKDMQV